MKIERRDYAVFIAHNNLAVFVNRCKKQEKPTDHYFLLRVNKGLHGLDGKVENWITLGEMSIEPEDLKDFIAKLTELAQ